MHGPAIFPAYNARGELIDPLVPAWLEASKLSTSRVASLNLLSQHTLDCLSLFNHS